uniref:Aminopeptidase n=1 Tax=Chilo suppressalis TaxID=168631 RepID=A0A5J6KIF4_CHISP|nr:aminopeptidase N8 [Chilo suppressalis]
MYRLLMLASCLLIQNVNSDQNYRLNTPIRPSEYSVVITPYFNTDDSKAFTFDGEVTITFTTNEITNQIKLHSENLTFAAENVTVSVPSSSNRIELDNTNPLNFDTFYTFAFINLQTELQVGVVYELKIVYTGPIRDDLNGFYRNYYIENGEKKWLGATQMETTHARKVFPCFDEPELKATFDLTIDRPESYKPSLANTKMETSINLNNGYVREKFYPTPRMPTYLVAFLVSEFEAARYNISQSNEFGVFTRPEAVNQSEYTFDFGLRVVEALGQYFGVDYYSTNSNLKLDHVALINFRAGAMENWGLVTYRESLLLYVPGESTPYYKYRVAQIVAHETTHMWFGNLVTCHWWSNTWLNEGFANYFQDYITHLIEPEVGSGNILVTGSVYAAYDADDSPTSPPITNNDVNSPAEISGHFGTITYQKAGSVIRMMHHLLGDDAFKIGLNTYLTSNQFQSGYPDLLYAGLQSGVASTSALASYPGATVASVMESWITQAGHPVLEVTVDYEKEVVTLNQRRFYVNGSHSSNEIYKIPITYTTAVSPDFTNTKPLLIMEARSVSMNVSNIGLNHSWIIFNVQETGFYRVKYDDHAYQIIANALKGSQRTDIHHLNRAKIVNDLFAFFYADEVKFSSIYSVLDFMKEETDFSVWYAAIRGLSKLRNMYQGTDALPEIEAYALSLMDKIIADLGYEEKDGDDFETLRNRMQILEFACKLGHTGCIEEENKLFRSFVDNGVAISPSLRPVAYCTGLRVGDEADYNFLWRRMSTTNVANEARLIGEILGCAQHESSLKKYLVSMLEVDSPIMTQDLTMPLGAVLGNRSHVPIVIEELKNNLSTWKTIYSSMDTVYTSIASVLRTEQEINEFESWLNSCEECGSKDGALGKLADVRAALQWANSHKNDVLSSLTNSAKLTGASVLMIAIGILMAYVY